ncbi:MAG TPA: nickel-type superoxide dismutase maturation protease [Acidimicrobiales bacterium]|nr:nickel-type superoxide dismutase maturation protease [Acidimicrobiales bacterium]
MGTVWYEGHLTHGRRAVNRAWRRRGVYMFAAAAVAASWVRPRRVAVEGSSMEPVLTGGDRLFVMRGRSPRVGDIVAVRDPRDARRLLVKRVVSVRGAEVVLEGDNARASTDSRDFGPVDRRAVVGRAVYRYAPAGRTGPLR